MGEAGGGGQVGGGEEVGEEGEEEEAEQEEEVRGEEGALQIGSVRRVRGLEGDGGKQAHTDRPNHIYGVHVRPATHRLPCHSLLPCRRLPTFLLNNPYFRHYFDQRPHCILNDR